jgi:hypothetical protein
MTSDAISQPVPLRELRPDPSYARYQLQVSASQLSSLTALGRLAFREPIVTTRKMGSSLTAMLDGNWPVARVAKRFLALNTT